MTYQIIGTDLLSEILVVDTWGRVQNMEIMNIINLNLNNFIYILKPSLVQIYQDLYLLGGTH